MSKGCLFYVHMGKTGGGTINKWLLSVIDAHALFQGQFDGHARLTGMASLDSAREALSTLPMQTVKALKLVTGHLPLSLINHLPQPTQCVTVVREPIDREISSLYYLKTLGGERGAYFKRLSVSDYARDSAAADNYQVRILSGLDELNPIWHDDIHYQSIQGRLDILELAKANLKKYFVIVGLLESLEQFAEAVSKLVGYSAPTSLGRENVTPYRITHQEISAQEIEMLKTKIDLDLALYDWIKQQKSKGLFNGPTLKSKFLKYFKVRKI